MAARVSLSGSFEASVILQHQLSHQHPSQPQPQQQQQIDRQQSQEPQKLGFCVQILLVAALMGVEMSVAFQQIYNVLINQYMGVPVSLVSLDTTLCGVVTMVLVPVAGCFVDRGPRPKVRKMCFVFVGMSIYLCGYSILAAAGMIKLITVGGLVNNISSSNTTSYLFNSSDSSAGSMSDDTLTYHLPDIATSLSVPETNGSETLTGLGIPETAIMAILGFTFLDSGFDLGSSMIRAFILDCVPSMHQAKLLVTATAIQSIGGTALSIIGCFDLPELLGTTFRVDGVAATLILFCALLSLIVFVTYSVTVYTGHVVSKKFESVTKSVLNDVQEIQKSQSVSPNSSQATRTEPARNVILGELLRPRKHQRSRSSSIYTGQDGISTMPLLEDDLAATADYQAVSDNMSLTYPDAKQAEIDLGEMESYNKPPVSSVDTDSHIASCPEADLYPRSEESFLRVSGHDPVQTEHNLSSPMVTSSPLGDFHARRISELDRKAPEKTNRLGIKNFCNKQLFVLCVSLSFCIGCSVTFTAFSANTLTIGIYKGDPTALPGTPGHQKYREGLRTAAMGNVVMFVTYMLISFKNKKLLDLMGEKIQYVICHMLLITTQLALIFTQRVEAYFVFMATCGMYRPCIYTIPYLLAYKYTRGEALSDVAKSDKPVKNIGQVMSLISFLITLQYVSLASIMGPLMDVLGSVWVPQVYGIISCTLSLLMFIPLFFMKG